MAQQERARQTRQAILLGAASVFDSKGFDAATLLDIVNAAQTTKGAFYFHFASKDEVARAVIAEQTEWLSTAPSGTGSPLQEVIDISFGFSRALRSDALLRASIRLTIERGTFQEPNPDTYKLWDDVVADRIAQAKRKGQVQDHWSPRQVARLITGSITGLQLASEVATGRQDLDQRIKQFWKALIPGVVNADHIKDLRLHPPRRR